MTTCSSAAAVAVSVAAGNEQEESWAELADWELTFNVWHMLPWMERKQMANKHGCKTIGEFEEYMSMKRAMLGEGNKNGASVQKKPYPNDEAYAWNKKQEKEQNESKPPAKPKSVDDDERQADEEKEIAVEEEIEANPDDALSDEELLRLGGQILILPEELLHTIFAYLSVDTYASLSLVSPHWKHFTRTEAVYKRLCERTYLQQSKRRTLNVARFNNSYRTMLYTRPRVRNGLYVLKSAKVKKIQRDMWCEIPVGAILETVYYRYVYFLENGTVLYALTATAPHEMIHRLLRVLRNPRGEPDRAAVWGSYIVQGKKVTVTARQEWQYVQLELSIESSSHWGRFGSLSFDRHLTSVSGHFDEYAWPNDIHYFEVPHEVFRYVTDRRLN